MIRQFGNIGNALEYAYPNAEWNSEIISSKKKKKVGQRFLFLGNLFDIYFLEICSIFFLKLKNYRWLSVMLKDIFACEIEILEDFLHPDLTWGIFFFS